MVLIALFAYLLLFFCVASFINKAFKVPQRYLPGIAYISISGLLCFVFNILSNGRFIYTSSVLLFVLGIFIFCVRFGYLDFKFVRYFIKIFTRSQVFYLLLPLILGFFIVSITFAPNTYDSMSYHLPRVLHWMQNHSIKYYSTTIDRQNIFPPGAEYLILFLHLISNTDILSNLVQFFAFLCLIPTLHSFFRLFIRDKKILIAFELLALSTPAVFFQASTTQNDLVAALCCFVIIFSSRRLWFGSLKKFNLRSGFLLGFLIGCSILIKATSVFAALPFLLLGVFKQKQALIKHVKSNLLDFSLLALCMFLGVYSVTAVDFDRKIRATGSIYAGRGEVYKTFSGWNRDRLFNPIRATCQHAVFIEKHTHILFSLSELLGGNESKSIYCGESLQAHEDWIGSPIQMHLIMFSLPFLILISIIYIKKRKPIFYLAVSWTPIASWFFSNWMVANNPYTARYQMAIFLLSPLALLVFFKHFLNYKMLYKILCSALILTVGLSMYFSLFFYFQSTSKNFDRSFLGVKRTKITREEEYYAPYPPVYYELKITHDFVLKEMQEKSCNELGVIFWYNDMEYPLSWRAYQKGYRVTHMSEKRPAHIPCHVYINKMDVTKYPWLQQLCVKLSETSYDCGKGS